MLFEKVILVFVNHFLSILSFKIEFLFVCLYISKLETIFKIELNQAFKWTIS